MDLIEVYEFDYWNLDELAQNELHIKNYRVLDNWETDNNTYHVFRDLIGRTFDQADQNRILSGGKNFGPDEVLQALIAKGSLQPGNYLMRVSW